MNQDKVSPGNAHIGWIGIGVMGRSMAMHVLKAGYNLTVYNRTREKASELLDQGAKWADSPLETAKSSDVIITMVGYPADVEEVYFSEKGILNGASSGKILVDMTTTSPSIAEKIYKKAAEKGCFSIDAPVSGGDVGAKNATLSIMAGGDENIFNRILPLLQIMGKNIVYQGRAGAGQHTKMCNQVTIAGTMIGVCEALLYGYKSGLDLPTMLSSISKGAAGCWTLDNLAPRIINRNFDPGFYVDHFIKDMGIALDEAKRMGIALPGLALAHQLYMAVKVQGHGRKGTHALMLALEHISGINH